MASFNKDAGVYQIKNTATGKVYIGSTNNFVKREKQHFSLLKRGTHPCIHLQNSFNTYGEEAFVFEILVICDLEALLDIEQEHIDANIEFGLYNSSLSAHRKFHSEETKQRMSAASKGVPKSDEHKLALSKAKLGKKGPPRTEEWLRNQAEGIRNSPSLKNRGFTQNPEYKLGQSLRMKEVWARRKSLKG